MYQMRGVRNPCPKCQGMGVLCYSSGATWRGGMGTASFEWAECDECWGSGDEHRHHMDLRKLEANIDDRVKQEAADLLRRRTGLFLSSLQAGGLEVADELEKFERQRRARPHGFHTVASCLAKVLREIVEASTKAGAPTHELAREFGISLRNTQKLVYTNARATPTPPLNRKGMDGRG